MNSSHEACSKTSNDKIRIALEPLGKQFEVERGTALQDILFQHGVEFPCGGQGQCKGCRVRVVHGSLAVDDHAAETNDHHASLLSDEELAAGWRLACCCRADGDLVLDVGQWEQPILADDSHFAFTPREGLGIAIDLGTTTLVAQLVDRRTGHVLAVESALNPQAAHGADLMSRVQFGTTPTNREILTQQIRSTLGQMVRNLLATQSSMTSSPSSMLDVRRVVIVGNTVMNYLFCGLDLTSIANAPFEIESIGPQSFSAKQLDWNVPGEPCIEFLPSLGGFVGSDIL
ncbi:MAG: 2Fe-2S iron-sulfur cluster-binding protein, partial [Phycisphaerae bacterium]|nr:2Fe-2S iron-sulfur cluster-binding protein [Phycisphaerae bacterium]